MLVAAEVAHHHRAARHAQRHEGAVHGEVGAGDLLHARIELGRLRLVGLGHDERELRPVHAVGHAAAAHLVGQALAEGAQQAVAERVAVYLVDVAELVHPHEQHELATPKPHGRPQGAEELVAVVESRDRVDALHDAVVRDHAGEQVRLAALPLQHHSAAAARDVVAVTIAGTVQEVMAQLAAREHGLDVGHVEGRSSGWMRCSQMAPAACRYSPGSPKRSTALRDQRETSVCMLHR